MASKSVLIIGLLVTLLSVSYSFITWIIPNQPLNGFRAAPGAPWPIPSNWINSTNRYTLDLQVFAMTSNLQGCDVIDYNLNAYLAYIFFDKHGTFDATIPKLTGVQINVIDPTCVGYLQLDADESYAITIDETNTVAQLNAPTIWGALRALETFSQMIYQTPDHTYYVNHTSVTDSPRFSHRGLMIDTARHFIPQRILLENLRAMQFNKLNVFHWHLTDDQSFPYVSLTYPELSEKGAYWPNHIYTNEDVNDIIETARLMGIRVIPEFDSPGHTRAIGNSHSNLLTACYGDGEHPYTPYYPSYSEMEIFDPTNEDVYTFMRNLISEVKTVFKDSFIHLGMDEVTYNCWKSNPYITQFMADNNLNSYSQLEALYTNRVINITESLGYQYVIWQDPIDNGVVVDSDTLVHVWKDTSLDSTMLPWETYIANVAEKGYKILLSSCWYVNQISYGPDWKNYYQCDPTNFAGTDEEKSLVMGGEAAMWDEYADGSNLLPRLWPRVSAVAERLWSPESVVDVDAANFRLDQQRCRMILRGIPAEPILNGYCGDFEPGMLPEPQNP